MGPLLFVFFLSHGLQTSLILARPVTIRFLTFFPSICWWHQALHWCKLVFSCITDCFHRIMHPESSWLAPKQWSSPQSIFFFNSRSKPLQTLAESIGPISVAGSPIKLQTAIKNVGVYLDSRLSFDKQASEIFKASYFQIRALRHIRSSLTSEAAKTIVSAIVGSQLDYCNSLLAGTSVSNLAHLQLVQNTLARVALHAL